MNWFEDDRGNWFNLAKAKAIYPPGADSAGNAELEFSDRDSRVITPAEWPRLLAHLRNSQNPWSLLAPFAPAVPPEAAPPAAGLPPAETETEVRIPQNLASDINLRD